jgi:DNA invertase Pin-like site-specific DNA recombinase
MQAVVYAAKSTADEKGSIPTQLSDGRERAGRGGWSVAGEYKDEAKSAHHGSRGPGLEEAMAHAERIAPCVFIVQHSDRLARGDGKQARHLVEIVLWAIKHDVQLLSVQDPEMLAGGDMALLMGTIGGMRNNQDSERKGKATKDGHRRAVVERGEWRGGILPAGYSIVRTVDARGKVEREIIKRADDELIYELLWQLALDNASEQHIALELNRRGYLTRPVRKGQSRVAFSAGRVSQILNNPFYAGMQPLNGELSPGSWPTYVDFEDWQRLRTERRERGGATARKRGRPPEGYLLSELAICGTCGSAMQGRSTHTRKKDGVRSRAYVCRAHREHHEQDEHFCPAMPLDGTAVDRLVVGGIEALLRDADALREQLRAGQNAERDKLASSVKSASDAATAADRAAERATTEFASAVDDDERALLKDAAKASRTEAARARKLVDAALDALNSLDDHERDPAESAAALWESIGSEIAKADGDAKTLNAVLRETFLSFAIGLADDGRISMRPRLRPDARTKHADPSGVVRIVEAERTWLAAPRGDGDEGGVLLVG